MPTDVLSKIRVIVQVSQEDFFVDAGSFAMEVRRRAVTDGAESAFRLPGTRGGNADSVASLLTITKHVEFCAALRLIEFHEGADLLPHQPLVKFDDKLDRAIANQLWSLLEREGLSRGALRRAMKDARVRDPMSIWAKLRVRNISRDTFRKCLFLLSQLPDGVTLNRKWTYDLEGQTA